MANNANFFRWTVVIVRLSALLTAPDALVTTSGYVPPAMVMGSCSRILSRLHSSGGASTPHRHNLPEPATRLIGREYELGKATIDSGESFEGAAREESFGQARQKDSIEGAAAGLVNGADKYVAVTAARRVRSQLAHFLRQHVVDFVERGRPHFAQPPEG